MKRFFLLTFIILAIMSGCNDAASRNKCMEIECGEWQECNQKNGECEAKIGRCDDDTDCVDPQICDDGHVCVDDTDLCKNLNCPEHSECIIDNNLAKCECDDGYHLDGLQCIKDDDLCQVVVCDDWNICNPGTGQCGPREGRCNEQADCSESQFCDLTHTCIENPCNGKDCAGHGRCEVINEEATCICEDGYEGAFDNCYDIDECKDGISNCSENATCENTQGSYTCTCNEGYTGDGIVCNPEDLCLDVICDEWEECNPETGSCDFKDGRCAIQTDCLQSQVCNSSHTCVENLCNVIDCSGHGRCELINDSAVCNCDEGFISDGINCNDINECITENINCDVGYACLNTEGSYICADIDECGKGNTSCTPGYVCENTDGSYNCIDINECSTGTAQCPDGYWCENTVGSYTCFNDIDECAEGLVVCQEGYTCENIINSYNCIDIDECANGSDNCSENAICVNTDGGFTCTCKAGYEGDGITCVDIDECANGTNECEATEVCQNTNGSYICVGSCGNGTISSNEDCEGNDLLGETCISLGYSGGELLCNETCKFDISTCRTTVQTGTTGDDVGLGIATDKNRNVFITGTTAGNMNGNSSFGGIDSFLIKYDSCGNLLWTKQFGTSSDDGGYGIDVDSNGNVFVSGWTLGDWAGTVGGVDIILTKFDNDGNMIWKRQFGSTLSDSGERVIVDNNGNVFVTGAQAGSYYDIFLTKFNNNGDLIWSKQWGTSNHDVGMDLKHDKNGNIFVTGYATGDLNGNIHNGGSDIFLTKWDNDGNEVWTKQWGTSGDDWAQGVIVNEDGSIVVSGLTSGDLDGNISLGGLDVFLTKFDISGNKLWTKQFGTDSDEVNYRMDMEIDSDENLVIIGGTNGSFEGYVNSGNQDIFLAKFNKNGIKQWIRQWGSTDVDGGNSLDIDNNNTVLTVGTVSGSLDGNPWFGSGDVFFVKFDSGNGIVCDDVNECANGSDNCSENAICVNTDGGFTCNCKAGYEGDGITCIDIDECANGTNNCSVNATCVNTDGSFVCSCKPGYEGNGVTCDNVNHDSVQLGTSAYDSGFAVTTDINGNVFITGETNGALDGNTHNGSADIYLTKYDNCKNKLWTKQWGTASYENGEGITTDITGNVYVVGYTDGGLDGNSFSGDSDAFITKFDNNGNKLWTKQIGTSSYDRANSVSVDENKNIYITGYTSGNLNGNTLLGNYDAFLIKLDENGNNLWTKQWGSTAEDNGYSVKVYENEVIVTGFTAGGIDGNINAGNYDIYMTEFDTNGNKLWTKQWGTTTADLMTGTHTLVIDQNGNIFITGVTSSGLDGNTSYGSNDSFLTKFDKNGNKLWTKQTGTTGNDYGMSIDIDSDLNIIMTGYTNGVMLDNASSGNYDSYVIKFDNNGNILWSEQWGTAANDYALGISVYNKNVFVTGETGGNLDGNINAGGQDIFLTKFTLGEDNCGNQVNLGTPADEYIQQSIIDSIGDIYAVGYTSGDFDGNTNIGGWDAILIKYDSNGNKLWSKQFGTEGRDLGYSVALDSNKNIYVSGETSGAFPENTYNGGTDIFLTKFDSTGNIIWSKQLGGSGDDWGYRMKIYNDEIYLTGGTSGSLYDNTFGGYWDVILLKLDLSGNNLWAKQYGGGGAEYATSIEIDSSGNIYLGGLTQASSLGGNDMLLLKYDSSGNFIWDYRFGSSGHDRMEEMVIDSSDNIHTIGYIYSPNYQIGDVLYSKINTDGQEITSKIFSTGITAYPTDIILDTDENPIIMGWIRDSFDGNLYQGEKDTFIVKLDENNEILWSKQIGTSGSEESGATLMLDQAGNLIFICSTSGSFPGFTNNGGYDVFLMKFPAP